MERPPKTSAWRPPTDLYETESAVVVRVEVAGIQPGDFTITLDRRRLIVRGARQTVVEPRAYHQMEISFGNFFSELEIPCAIDADEIEAQYSGGFLEIVLPKSQPHHIKVDEEANTSSR
jgi:HSP20 family molecular chaperone IbpA